MHRPVRFPADIEPLVQFIEETDPKRHIVRIVPESFSWSSKVGDLYYENKDGSRVTENVRTVKF